MTDKKKKDRCPECFGTGKLTRLGGDWGKTPETKVPCWACNGTGEKT
jgi:DnaJ-class molecular chaperone